MCEPWFVQHLVCPRDHEGLTQDEGELICPSGHRYPIVEGVPVMLLDDVGQTMNVADASLRQARIGQGRKDDGPDWYLDSLGISEREKTGVVELARESPPVDPVVAYLIAATNGLMYRHLIGRLGTYPIPELPLQLGNGRRLLDVGCSWGRWSLAADARGYDTVGIDPSLGAVMAARRVASQLGVPNHYVVGDARFLPFRAGTFDQTFSYSVLQHFSPEDAARSLGEMGRVLKDGGAAKVQIPTRFGVRCLYHQLRRGFREPTGFEVRYWTRHELQRTLIGCVGRARFEVDCFFGIGLQRSDAHLMTAKLRLVLRLSEALKATARHIPMLSSLADSVFVTALKTSHA